MTTMHSRKYRYRSSDHLPPARSKPGNATCSCHWHVAPVTAQAWLPFETQHKHEANKLCGMVTLCMSVCMCFGYSHDHLAQTRPPARMLVQPCKGARSKAKTAHLWGAGCYALPYGIWPYICMLAHLDHVGPIGPVMLASTPGPCCGWG